MFINFPSFFYTTLTIREVFFIFCFLYFNNILFYTAQKQKWHVSCALYHNYHATVKQWYFCPSITIYTQR